jgi:hypothetical protein
MMEHHRRMSRQDTEGRCTSDLPRTDSAAAFLMQMAKARRTGVN